MQIELLTTANIPAVAALMHRLRPDTWEVDDAIAHLGTGIGWAITNDSHHPTGWVLCTWHETYRIGEIIGLGADERGHYSVGPALAPLLNQCVLWAQERQARYLSYVIGSRGFTCHLRPLGHIGEELQNLKATNRPEYQWWASQGFTPAGMLPEIHGRGYHGILLIRAIS